MSGIHGQSLKSAAIISSSASRGSSTFLVAPSISLGYAPSGIASGDLRHSGKLDLVTADYVSGKITVFLGTVQGNFAAPAQYDSGPHPTSVVVVDMNGDGRLDVVACNDTEGTISVLNGAGDGTFQPRRSYTVGFNPSIIATGDLSGNGRVDVAVVGKSANQLAILPNDGTGGFQKPILYKLSKVPAALTVADFNHDGFPDIALVNIDGTVSILLGKGAGQFRPLADVSVATGTLSSIVAADFNRDGKIDIAVTEPDQKLVSILMGKGDGTLTSSSSVSVVNNPVFLLAADVDGDGVPDLIALNQASNTFSILAGNGDGTFKSKGDFVTGNGPSAAVAGDFYGNGHVDLAIINQTSQTVTIPLGNGDGTFKTSRSYAAGLKPVSIASDNLTGDKTPGLVVANYCGSDPSCGQQGNIAVLLADDQGVYRLSSTYSVGVGTVAVALADVNGDRNLDIVALNRLDKTLSVLYGVGDGTFATPTTFPLAGAPIAVAAGDLNNDGKPDLAVLSDCGSDLCSQPGTLSILIGSGDGNFQDTVSYPVGYAPASVAVGDVNGDKNLDIVVANRCGNDASCLSPGTGTVLVGEGTGRFTAGKDLALGNSPSSIALGNLSGSGMDLVVSWPTENAVAALRGNGDGSFQAAVSYPVGAAPGSLVIADFNGDKQPDVAVANTADATVSVLFGSSNGKLQPAFAVPVSGNPSSLIAIPSATGRASLATPSGSTTASTAASNVTVVPNLAVRPALGVGTPFINVTIGPSASTVNASPAVSLGVTVSGIPIPTGTVDFEGFPVAHSLCPTQTLDGTGAASCTTQALLATDTRVTAVYNGDTNFALVVSTFPTTVNALTPTVAITPSPASPSPLNTPVTFTAGLTGVPLTPTAPSGTMTFALGGTTIPTCTQTVATNGTVACPVANIAVGANTITATYSGDSNFVVASPGSAAYTVDKASTTLTTTSTPASPSVNSAVTFTATLTGLFTPAPPTGTITFADNLTPIGTCTAQGISASGPNYVATCVISNLAVGSHSISTVYIGDGNFNGSTSASLPMTIGQAATTLTIAAPAATAVNTTATFTATLHGTFTPAVPTTGSAVTSTVNFIADAGTANQVILCTAVPLTAVTFTATCSSNVLNATAHSISATYSGDTNFATSSTTASASYMPTKLTGTLATASSVGASTTVGTQVTFTVAFTVSAVTPLAPNGNVSFTVNGVADARCPAMAINASQAATCVTNELTSGKYQIGASYSGDTNFNSATATAFNLSVNKAAPTIGLTATSTTTPAVVNEPVAFTATVPTPGTGVQTILPTGTVTFKQGAATLCANAGLNASNPPQALCPYSFPSQVAAPGTVTATYSGDSNFTVGTTGSTTGTVNTASSTTVIASSGTVNVGQAVIYATTIGPQYPAPPSYPQGTVTFTTNANPAPTGSCTTPLTVSGTGSVGNCTLIFSSGGIWNVIAQYVSSNNNFSSSTSSTVVQAVNNGAVGINLISDANPILVNQSVTFSATFVPSIPSPVPSGNVTYADNGTTLCTVSISGTGTIPNCTYTFTSAGSHSILASFPGSGSYNAAGSNALTQVVNHVPVTTTVTGPASAAVNQMLTFTAKVLGTFTPVPPITGSSTTSTVAFFADGTAISGCSATQLAVNAGVYTATCSTNSLSANTHNISATYSGDSNFSTSVSSTLSQVISPLASTLNLTAAPSSPTSVNTTASFTAVLGGVALTPIAPSGKVSFTANGAILNACSAVPVDATGKATCLTSSLQAGADQIGATYSGDINFTVSSPGAVSFTITALTPTLGVTASPSSSTTIGTPVTFTAQLAGAAFTPVNPSGTVRFSANGSTIAGCWAVTVDASGEASCSTSALAPGSAAIAAVYSRDANFTASAPGTATQFVSKISPTLGIALTSGANPSAYGAALTFTATVTGVSGFSPTGSVSFTDTGGSLNCTNSGTLTSSGSTSGSATCNVPALAVGQHQITVTYVPGTDPDYLPAGPSAPIGQIVNLGNPALSLNCTRVTYDGNPHSCVGSATGMAGAALAGTWSYSPSAATNAGSTPVTATFTSSDANYADGTVSGTLMIDKATPQLIWATPAAITYGTALSVTQLNASSTTSGAFAYSPAAGTVLSAGQQMLSATFTPTDGNNFAIGTATAQLTINKAVPSIQVTPSSSSITTAQILSVSLVVRGVVGPAPAGSVTLASSSYTSSLTALVNGSATIDIPAGSLSAGNDTIIATYSGEANYGAATGTTSVTVAAPVNPSFAVSGTSVTLATGATTGNTSIISVTPAGGFTGSVVLTAAVTSSPVGAQHPPTLTFGSTSPVSISGATAGTAILTISTTAATSAAIVQPKHTGVPWYAAGGATLACILLFGMRARRRSWQTFLGVLALMVALSGSMLACGGSNSKGGGGTSILGTTAGAYTVTVTGTSGATAATGTVNLTVQ